MIRHVLEYYLFFIQFILLFFYDENNFDLENIMIKFLNFFILNKKNQKYFHSMTYSLVG